MSYTRGHLKGLLKNTENNFQCSEIQKAILKSQKNILSGNTNRAFDDFPSLLSYSDFKYFKDKMANIILDVQQIVKTDNGFLLVDRKDKLELIRLQKKLIDIGLDELITKDGRINQEIYKLMQWDTLNIKIDPIKLLCAYVSSNNISILKELSPIIVESQDQYHAVCHYLNTYYNSWVVDTFKVQKIPYDKSHDQFLKHDPAYTEKLTNGELVTIGISVTAAALTGLSLLGYALYKGFNTSTTMDAPFKTPTQKRL
jgi:hypothetical protein